MRTTLEHPEILGESGAVASTEPEDTGPEDTEPGTSPATWRDALRIAAQGQLALAAFLLAITIVFERRFDPIPVVIGLIVAGGIVLLRRSRGRGGVVYVGVVSLLLFSMVAMFGGFAVFTRPESTFDLILFGGTLVMTALGLVATVGAFRGGAGRAAHLAPKAAVALVAVLVVVGIVAGMRIGSAVRMPGDLVVQAKNFEFTETELVADAGSVAVFVENEDVAHHDFTINGLTSVSLPGQRAGRAAFDVDEGTYRFYCSLHPDMEGTLKVT